MYKLYYVCMWYMWAPMYVMYVYMYVPCGKYYIHVRNVPFFQGIHVQKLSTIEKKNYRCSCEHDGLSSDY